MLPPVLHITTNFALPIFTIIAKNNENNIVVLEKRYSSINSAVHYKSLNLICK